MPSCNVMLDTTPLSIFDELEAIIASKKTVEFIKLHQGKTVFPPCVHLHNWQLSDFPLLAHQHASPLGVTELKQKIADTFNNKNEMKIVEKNIFVTCGATHGIGTTFKAILQPNDEVLILSPQWLFVVGLVYAANGRPIEVPVFLELENDPSFDLIAALQKKLTNKTKAIYFNTPNNPTGYSFNKEMLQSIALFAKENDLWIISDNAYENYDYTLDGFIDISNFYDAKDRTFSIYTFSKTFAMPGHRIGFIISPDCMTERVKKWGLYSIYSLSTTSQYNALQALHVNNKTLEAYRNTVKQTIDIIDQKLLIPHTKIRGGFYTFLNLSQWHKGTTNDFLIKSIDAGVSLAPGVYFGKHCTEYARLCFTAVSINLLEVGIERLNKVYYS